MNGILFLSKVCGNQNTLGHIEGNRIKKKLDAMNDSTETYDPEDQFIMLLDQMALERDGFKPTTIKTLYKTHVLAWAVFLLIRTIEHSGPGPRMDYIEEGDERLRPRSSSPLPQKRRTSFLRC